MTVRVLIFLSLCASLILSTPPVAAEPTKLRVTLQLPITDALLGRSLARFTEDVAKRSDGAITIEIFDKGKLYTDDQTVGAVETGAIEMGVAGFNQFAKRIAGLDIMEQPFLFNYEALVRANAGRDSPIRKLIDQTILETVGVRVLSWQSVGNQIFISKGEPVNDPGRIAGHKIRVFSPTHAKFVAHCGGTPVMVGANKTPEAFKTGKIDMATGASSLIANRKLWTVADRITRTLHAPIEFFLIVNEKVWQALPEAKRAIIIEAARSEEEHARENVTKVEAGLYTSFREKGMTVHDLTPDQVADWRACSASILEDYISGDNWLAQQLMAAYGRLRTDPCCTSGPETAGSTFSRR
ncbi:MAG TPA: TRAP transporter substrate-binding protein DctP [Hyphomicrobiaceae bacterium]|nr:TRAP transporter substrate-binding protein DctP [Hyphomicrobiaceae bacterium]